VPTTARTLEKAEADRAAKSETTFTAYLGRFVELELADKADGSIKARIARARFPVLRTLEQFDFDLSAQSLRGTGARAGQPGVSGPGRQRAVCRRAGAARRISVLRWRSMPAPHGTSWRAGALDPRLTAHHQQRAIRRLGQTLRRRSIGLRHPRPAAAPEPYHILRQRQIGSSNRQGHSAIERSKWRQPCGLTL
jgi:hypothetical protein